MFKPSTISRNLLIPEQSQALSSILNQVTQNTNFLSDYLKNMISQGPSSTRIQNAVTNYREQVLPQILGSLGEGKSSSALNQALSTGAQSLAQTLDADSMAALQMLQQLTQSSAATGLGTQAKAFSSTPGAGMTILNFLLNMLSQGGSGIIGQLLANTKYGQSIGGAS